MYSTLRKNKREMAGLRLKIVPNTNGGEKDHAINSSEAVSTHHTKEVKLSFAPNRYVVYCRFNDQDLIHIREYAIKKIPNATGEYPTRRGVCFTPERLKSLYNKIDQIEENLNQEGEMRSYKTHIAAGIYAAVGKLDGVDIRRYWTPEGQIDIVPTKRGIFLPRYQWASVKEKLDEILEMYPIIGMAEECFHQNQMGYVECRECMPFGWIMP